MGNKKIGQRIGYGAILVVSVLLLIEAACRIFFWEPLSSDTLKPLAYRPDSVVNYLYIPNLDFEVNGNRFHVNKQGFLGGDFPDKSSGKFRIAVTGDSFVSGTLTMPYYTTFVQELQKMLDSAGYRVEVLNCGVDGGARDYDIFKMIPYKIAPLQPDLVLAACGLPLATDNLRREPYCGYLMEYPAGNDSIRRAEMRAIDGMVAWKPWLDALYHSYMVRLAIKLHYKYGKQGPLKTYNLMYRSGVHRCFDSSGRVQFDMQQSAEMARRLQQDLQRRNIRLFFFDSSVDPGFMAEAKTYRLPFINLKAELDREQGDFFRHDAHPSRRGNRKIAARFCDILIRHELIPPQYGPQDSAAAVRVKR